MTTDAIHAAELRVIGAARKDHRGGCAPETCGGSRLDPCALRNALDHLDITCPECNAGGHTCPGDGNDIPHGATDCGKHADDEQAGMRIERESIAAEEAHLADLVLETARGWLDYADWLDCHQVKIVHMDDGTMRVVGDSGVIGEYVVTVSARKLPPLGPEDDGALRAEPAAIEAAKLEPAWVLRTWRDVRTGDRVRIPGTETAAYVQHASPRQWHVAPGTGTSSFNPPQRLDHDVMHVVLSTQDAQTPEFDMDATKPIEIFLTPAEVQAIELLGWDNRIWAAIPRQR